MLEYLLLLFLSVLPCTFGVDIPPKVPSYLAMGKPTNEGVRLRITKPGLEHITVTAGHIADSFVPTVKIADQSRDLTQPVPGKLDVKNIKIENYKPPDHYLLDLQSPKEMKVSATNMDVEASFDYKLDITLGKAGGPLAGFAGFLSAVPAFGSSGIGVAKAVKQDIFTTLSLNKAADSGLELKLEQCSGQFGSLDVLVKDDKISGAQKLALEKSTQDIIVDSICKQISKVIHDKVNKNLKSLATVKSLKLDDVDDKNSTKPTRPTGRPPTTKKPSGKGKDHKDDKTTAGDDSGVGDEEKILKNLMRKVKADVANLYLDYRLIRDPLVTPTYAEAGHKGEISWQKLGKTPFYPYDMPPIDSTSNRMMYLQVSEYTFNSLIYHAYVNKILKLTADEKETPYLSSSLTTTCPNKDDLLCFGNSFDSVAKKYPNHKIQLVTYPSQPPYMNVTSKGLLQQINGKLEVNAKPPTAKPQFNLFKADYSMFVAVVPQILNGKLYGNVTVDRVRVKVTDSPLDKTTQEDFANQAEFAIALIAEKLDGQLKKGMSMPQIGYATLVNPKTKLSDRLLAVESDFKLDEEKLKAEAKVSMGSH